MINNFKKRFITSLFLIFIFVSIIIFKPVLVFFLLILGTLSIIEFFNITKKIFINLYFKFLSNIIFIIYIFTFCFIFFIFNNIFHLKIILFIILSGCIASDIGGYVIGKIFMGPKLTKISPNKTISGSMGSFVFCYLTISLLFFYYLKEFNLSIFFVSLITSLFCQLGDLFFSYLKRKIKIKDTGNILPGHGGGLDRLDGILLGLPIGFVSLILLY